MLNDLYHWNIPVEIVPCNSFADCRLLILDLSKTALPKRSSTFFLFEQERSSRSSLHSTSPCSTGFFTSFYVSTDRCNNQSLGQGVSKRSLHALIQVAFTFSLRNLSESHPSVEHVNVSFFDIHLIRLARVELSCFPLSVSEYSTLRGVSS